MKRYFADTYYYLALLNPRDAAHAIARRTSASLSGELVTAHWVLTEVADALSSPNERPKFLALLTSLKNNPHVRMVQANEGLFYRGVEFYRQRPDKDWPLTDCISFVVMAEYGVAEALTDIHFRQAGFIPLLMLTDERS